MLVSSGFQICSIHFEYIVCVYAKNLIVLLKVEFLPKFSVSGIWKRWRESYPTEGSKADDATTVFTGVRIILISIDV